MDVDTALAEVPVNVMPLIDDTDFKTIENAVVYNAAGMALKWHFVTTTGVMTETAVIPTTAGVHDWTDQGTSGLYALEIPASAGTINNDTEGFGWFTGVATGILPWRGPVIGFRAAGLNDALIDDAYSVTRGLAGTALPTAAADAAGGLAISDAGGLDLDTKLANTNEITAARMGALTDWIDGGRLDLILDIIAADVVNLDGAVMRGTDGANTIVPDAAGVVPTAVENRQEMDANSADFNSLLAGQTIINDNVLLNGVDISSLLEALIMQKTTIATLASQTSFTLTAGSVDDGAYNEATIVIIDASTATQKAFGSSSDYVGSTKTLTLAQDPGIFTMAVGDIVYILPSDSFAIIDAVLLGNTHNVTSSLGRRIRGLQDFGNYLGGIHVDTLNGDAGTVPDENGTAENPVLTWADALTLNATLGYNQFFPKNGSTIELTADSTNYSIVGTNYSLLLGGQDVSGAYIEGANSVTGIGLNGGTKARFVDSLLETVTLPPFEAIRCCLTGTITASGAGDYLLVRCHSLIAGFSTPTFDFGAAVGNVNLSMPGYAQGIELLNYNATGTDEFSLSGDGQVIYAASCSGTVHQRGNWKVTNTGGVTIVLDDTSQGIIDIEEDTTEIGAAGAGLTAVALSATGNKAISDLILPPKNIALNDLDFLFVAASDNATPVTGATGTAVTRSIDGGAFGAGTGTIAEIGNGMYQYDASQADMNGGKIIFRFTGTGGTPGAPADTFLTVWTSE